MTKKSNLYQILSCVFVGSLLIANILAAKTFTLGSIIVPCGVIIFPVVYIVNDMLAELYDFKSVRKTIYIGFIMNAVAVIAYKIAIALPAPIFATETADAFALTLNNTWRLLLASFVAYLAGSIMNASIMIKMKESLNKYLALRCILSTLVGESIDAIIFISIAFAGTMDRKSLFIMIVSQAAFKTLYEIICYPATRTLIQKAKKAVD